MPPLVLALLLVTQPPAGEPLAEAAAHLDAGRPEQAISILTKLLEAEPDSIPVRFNLAVAQAMANQDAAAMEGFRKVLAAQPGLYEAELNLAQLLVKTGGHSEAEELIRKLIEKKPGQARLQLLLSRALSGQKKWDEAIPALGKAIEIDPSLKEMDMEMAALYESAGRTADAIAIYRKHPENPALRERVALYLLNQGDAAGAIVELEALVKMSPTPAVKYALATAYLRTGQPEKSIPLAASILETDPGNLEIRMFLGRLLRDQKQYAGAAKQFAAVVQAKPDSLEAWNEFTGMLILLEQFDPALQALEKVRALGGETAAYHYFRATMLDAQKQYKPALDSYRRFLAISEGKNPDEEFKARQRARIIERVLSK